MKYFSIIFFLFINSASADSIKIINNTPINKSGPSNSCVEEICTSLIELINDSQLSINFAIYGLRGQSDILNALIDAEKRGVSIRGIVDKDTRNTNIYFDTHLLEEKFSGKIKDDFEYDIDTKKNIIQINH